AGWGESIGTRHDQADPSHGTHWRLKSLAGLPVSPYLHQAQGQPKGRIIAEHVPVKSGPVEDRTSTLARRKSSATDALAKRIEEENARVNRLFKGICRGC